MSFQTRQHDIAHKKSSKLWRTVWWTTSCLLGILITLLVIAVAVFPGLAQQATNRTEIDVQWVSLKDPTPTSFRLDQFSILKPFYKYHASVSGMKVEVFLVDGEQSKFSFAEVTTLPLIAGGSSGILTRDQRVLITNVTEYQRLSNIVLHMKQFRVAARGKARVSLGMLHANIDVDKTITMPGMDGLRNSSFLSAKFRLVPEADGTNLISSVTVYNPTSISAVVGNITVDLAINGTSIGTATLIDTVITPKNNTLHLKATLDQVALMGLSKTLSKPFITIDSTGNSSLYHGEHLEFVERSFFNNAFHTTLNIASILENISIINSTNGDTKVTDIIAGTAQDPELMSLISSFRGTGNTSTTGSA